MKILLSNEEPLILHDGRPLLFLAKDPVGGRFVCLAVENEGETPLFIGVAISADRLRALKNAQIDLREVFAEPEMGAWFQVAIAEDGQATAGPIAGLQSLPENWLPAPGAFLENGQPGEASPLRPESFEGVKIEAVAKEAGINPGLLRQYLSGVKRPSEKQVRRVEDALHRVGQRLIEVRFL